VKLMYFFFSVVKSPYIFFQTKLKIKSKVF
jgi:hypothetical protein